MLIDTHAHLEEIEHLREVFKRAQGLGVEAVIAVGQDAASNKRVLQICNTLEKEITVYPALGVHPGKVQECDQKSALTFIQENIGDLVAVGEIGLDFWYKEARKEERVRELQIEIFRKQLVFAKRFAKPVIVHSRGSWRECLDILKEEGIKQVNFHWYSGPVDVLDEILECGYYISATPSAEYSKEHRSAILRAPLERIFLETDSPVRFRPQEGLYNAEPKDVVRTLRAVAQIKNLTEEEVARITESNARSFFNLG